MVIILKELKCIYMKINQKLKLNRINIMICIIINMTAIPPCEEDKKIEFFKSLATGKNLNILLKEF